MTSASQRIEEELHQLKEAIAQTGEELENAYENYLNGLGQALRQQLIHAAYHLCTQVYPAEFLKLSFAQREKLQQALIKMAIATQQEFLNLLSVNSLKSEEKEDFDGLFAENTEDEYPEDEYPESDYENSDLTEKFLSMNKSISQPDQKNSLEQPTAERTKTAKFGKFDNLEQLIKWQKQTEKAINKILTDLSIQANHLLYKNKVLPNHLPERLVERAVRMEPNESAIAGIPHLLNIVVEMERDEDDEDKKVTRLVAIYLRLSEVEFNDKTMNASRLGQQIKNILSKLQTIAQDQEKKQRKLSTIQAEDAWRASWYDS